MIARSLLAFTAIALGASPAFAHSEGIAVYSTAAGGGALAVTGVDDRPIHAALVFCSNGECLFVSEEGAILTPATGDEHEGLYALASETSIRLEIVSIDAGASIKVVGGKLDRAGESVGLGKSPLHAHPFWQIEAPEGEVGEWNVVFRFRAATGGYTPSPNLSVVVTNAEEGTTTSTSTTSTTLDAASCGNGVIDLDEVCDAGTEPWTTGRACTDSCEWLGCGDPDGDGASRATDALLVLAAAVGAASCDACVCNVDSSAAPFVSGGDALRILRHVVGLETSPLGCPVCAS